MGTGVLALLFCTDETFGVPGSVLVECLCNNVMEHAGTHAERYIYIYTHVYIHIYIYVCMCVSARVFLQICIHVYIDIPYIHTKILYV